MRADTAGQLADFLLVDQVKSSRSLLHAGQIQQFPLLRVLQLRLERDDDWPDEVSLCLPVLPRLTPHIRQETLQLANVGVELDEELDLVLAPLALPVVSLLRQAVSVNADLVLVGPPHGNLQLAGVVRVHLSQDQNVRCGQTEGAGLRVSTNVVSARHEIPVISAVGREALGIVLGVYRTTRDQLDCLLHLRPHWQRQRLQLNLLLLPLLLLLLTVVSVILDICLDDQCWPLTLH